MSAKPTPKKTLPAEVREYMAAIGRKGGRRSKRDLTTEQARAMIKVREARRAFKIFKALCFWSYDPDMKITSADVDWVAEMLMKHGNREALKVATRLCR